MTFSLTLKLLALLILACIIFGCSRKKKSPENLSQWLEVNFPGRYEVVETQIANPLRNLSFKVKKSVVADKTDSLLQVQIGWDKRQPDLDLAGLQIDSLFAEAKTELDKSRELLQWVKTGTPKPISVSVRYGVAYIFVFEEPTPENRRLVLSQLQKVISKWFDKNEQRGLEVHFMEPETYQTEFGNIVPLKMWIRPDIWIRRKTIVSLVVDDTTGFSLEKAEKQWQLSIDSDRALSWVNKAYPQAQNWALKHIKEAHTLSQEGEFYPLKKQLGLNISFPVVYPNTNEEEDTTHYVTGAFFMDGERFEQVKLR